jgi:hypothetical protein
VTVATGGTHNHTATSATAGGHSHTTGSHALSQAEMPQHGHGMFLSASTNGDGGTPGGLSRLTYFGDNVGNNRAYKMQATGSGSGIGATAPAGGTSAHNHGNTSTVAAHSHTITVAANGGSHSHTASSGSAGGHNHTTTVSTMQPYFVIDYIMYLG